MLRDLAASRLLRRALVAAVIVEHLLLIARPLNVLAPVDPWRIGHLVLTGHIPYRDFALEYPPLAVVAFLLPGLVPHGWALMVLALQSAIVDLSVIVLLRRWRPDAVYSYLLLSLALFPFLSGGFDALAVLAILLSTMLLVEGRTGGWWIAGAGALVKVVPATGWIWARRRPAAALGALVVTIAIALAPAALARHTDDSYVGYSLHRGVQIESLAGSAAWMGQRLRGRAPSVHYRFRSWEIDGADRLATATAVAAVLGLALVAATAGRHGMPDPEDAIRAALASVLLLTVGFKVLSPQYVAWGAPLACALGGRTVKVFAAVASLTLLAYVVGGSSTSFMERGSRRPRGHRGRQPHPSAVVGDSELIHSHARSTCVRKASRSPELSITKSALARRSSREACAAMRRAASSLSMPRSSTRRSSATSTGQSTTRSPTTLSRPDSTSSGMSRTTT
jgi:hypothetical protein